jgi:hypothetical protein
MQNVTGDHQCQFKNNKSTADKYFCMSDTGDQMGVQWVSTSAIHRLQVIPWFS